MAQSREMSLGPSPPWNVQKRKLVDRKYETGLMKSLWNMRGWLVQFHSTRRRTEVTAFGGNKRMFAEVWLSMGQTFCSCF